MQPKRQGSAEVVTSVMRFKHIGISPFPELDFSGLIQERGEEIEDVDALKASSGYSCMPAWQDFTTCFQLTRDRMCR